MNVAGAAVMIVSSCRPVRAAFRAATFEGRSYRPGAAPARSISAGTEVGAPTREAARPVSTTGSEFLVTGIVGSRRLLPEVFVGPLFRDSTVDFRADHGRVGGCAASVVLTARSVNGFCRRGQFEVARFGRRIPSDGRSRPTLARRRRAPKGSGGPAIAVGQGPTDRDRGPCRFVAEGVVKGESLCCARRVTVRVLVLSDIAHGGAEISVRFDGRSIRRGINRTAGKD
jgi:hypothetical protein